MPASHPLVEMQDYLAVPEEMFEKGIRWTPKALHPALWFGAETACAALQVPKSGSSQVIDTQRLTSFFKVTPPKVEVMGLETDFITPYEKRTYVNPEIGGVRKCVRVEASSTTIPPEGSKPQTSQRPSFAGPQTTPESSTEPPPLPPEVMAILENLSEAQRAALLAWLQQTGRTSSPP